MISNLNDNLAAMQAAIQAQSAQHAAAVAKRNQTDDFSAMLAQVNAVKQGVGTGNAGAGMGPALARRVGGSSGGGGGGTPLPNAKGNLHQWISTALGKLHMDPGLEGGIANMIQHESGGNPNAINKTDSNWIAGHPSKGLMQTIDSTFQGNALPGYNTNVYDPVSNIIAGTRYAVNRYGVNMLRSGGRKNSAGNYIGY